MEEGGRKRKKAEGVIEEPPHQQGGHRHHHHRLNAVTDGDERNYIGDEDDLFADLLGRQRGRS